MGSARTVPNNPRARNVYCLTAESDLIPAGIRLLLNDIAPKQLRYIQSVQDATAWERAALTLLADEDRDMKVSFVKVQSLSVGDAINLSAAKAGQDLLRGENKFLAGRVHLEGPDVDISQRIAPALLDAPHTGVHNVHRLYLSAAFRLLMNSSNVVQGGNTGVGALIVSPRGQILAWGKKNGAHPLLHAEMSALLMYGGRLPKGARIYSTLKPCKMCRAAIEHFSTDSTFLSYYGQDDATKAAAGPVDSTKFVYMSHRTSEGERPIWADSLRGAELHRRTSAAQKLHNTYTSARDRNSSLGIIDFLRGGKQDAHLRTAAGYLEIKRNKYANPSPSSALNENVEKCLTHIAEVMKLLGIPLPPNRY